MIKRQLLKGFALGCMLGVISVLTGCAGVPVKEVLPESVWLEATGSGEITIGIDEYPPVHLEHEGDLTVVWDFSWPPKIVEAEDCARIEWMFLEHESDGCSDEE